MSEQRFECLDRMLTANAKWASDVEEKEPSYFKDQFKGQAPPVRALCCFTTATVSDCVYRSFGLDVPTLAFPNLS